MVEVSPYGTEIKVRFGSGGGGGALGAAPAAEEWMSATDGRVALADHVVGGELVLEPDPVEVLLVAQLGVCSSMVKRALSMHRSVKHLLGKAIFLKPFVLLKSASYP